MGTVGWQKYSGINISETEITDNISVICTRKTYIHGKLINVCLSIKWKISVMFTVAGKSKKENV